MGEDKKFGWGMIPTLIAMGPLRETPKFPELEDIKKEVWLQLWKMVGHINMVPADLLHQYNSGVRGGCAGVEGWYGSCSKGTSDKAA